MARRPRATAAMQPWVACTEPDCGWVGRGRNMGGWHEDHTAKRPRKHNGPDGDVCFGYYAEAEYLLEGDPRIPAPPAPAP